MIYDCEDLACLMHQFASDGYEVTAILYYDDVIKLTKELLRYNCIQPAAMEFHQPFWDGYDSEYLVSISSDDMELYVEPGRVNGRYLQYDADIVFADETCCPDAVHREPGRVVIWFNVEE